MQSGDANQFSFAEAIRTMPADTRGSHTSAEPRSGAELTHGGPVVTLFNIPLRRFDTTHTVHVVLRAPLTPLTV